MRRLVLPALALLVAAPASAAAPQVTDPAGDANGTGVVTGAPASLAQYDITAVRWWADDAAQHVTVTLADTPGDGRYVLAFATPTCDGLRLEWSTGADTSYLMGCKPRQRRWPAAPVRSGRTLTFTIPLSALPTWVAEGTTLHALGATATPVVDVVVGAVYPPADAAASGTKYVVGS
jgi:hypothetical protein